MNCKHAVIQRREIVITFIVGLIIGSFAGMMLMALIVAGKKEGLIRDKML